MPGAWIPMDFDTWSMDFDGFEHPWMSNLEDVPRRFTLWMSQEHRFDARSMDLMPGARI